MQSQNVEATDKAKLWRNPGRCPKCRSSQTEWLPVNLKLQGGGMSCRDCGGEVKFDRFDPPPEWEARAARRLPDWDRYEQTNHLDRAWDDHDEETREIERAKPAPKEIFDVIAFLLGITRQAAVKINLDKPAEIAAHYDRYGAVERGIVGELSVALFGQSAKAVDDKIKATAKQWYRQDPRRSRFGRLGQALSHSAPMLGMGSVGLEIAESKVSSRGPAGFKNGLINAKASSINGSLGGAKGMVGIELSADVSRMIRISGISVEDATLLGIMHRPECKRPTKEDRLKAAERWLNNRGEFDLSYQAETPEEKLAATAKWNNRVDGVVDRVSRQCLLAQRKIEKAMRIAAPSPISLYDGLPHDPTEAPLLKPASAREQEERERDDAAEADIVRKAFARRNFDAEVMA